MNSSVFANAEYTGRLLNTRENVNFSAIKISAISFLQYCKKLYRNKDKCFKEPPHAVGIVGMIVHMRSIIHFMLSIPVFNRPLGVNT